MYERMPLGRYAIDVPNVEQSYKAKDVVAPLVRARNEGSDQTGDNEHDRHEQRREDVRERQSDGKEESKK